MTALSLFGYPASFAMGVALGLTGGGGSILTVPILVYLFGISPLLATGYSLAIVGVVALWGTWGAYRAKDLQLRSGFIFGVPGVAGVIFARRVLLPTVPGALSLWGKDFSKNSLLLILFSLLMIVASISMMRASSQAEPPIGAESKNSNQASPLWLALIGFAVGIVAGFVGAGGGFLIVPALVTLAGLEMRQAIGTSLLVISMQSLLGILGDGAVLSTIDGRLFALIAVLALLGMSIGGRLRHSFSVARLKFGFGVFVLVMGAVILMHEIV